jgi:hypothetical protein
MQQMSRNPRKITVRYSSNSNRRYPYLITLHIEIISYLSDPAEVYREISYSYPSHKPEEWRINFGGLQRTVLAKLQAEIFAKVSEIERNGCQVTDQVMSEIEPLISRYSESIFKLFETLQICVT